MRPRDRATIRVKATWFARVRPASGSSSTGWSPRSSGGSRLASCTTRITGRSLSTAASAATSSVASRCRITAPAWISLASQRAWLTMSRDGSTVGARAGGSSSWEVMTAQTSRLVFASTILRRASCGRSVRAVSASSSMWRSTSAALPRMSARISTGSPSGDS